jgi:hypothetical protein
LLQTGFQEPVKHLPAHFIYSIAGFYQDQLLSWAEGGGQVTVGASSSFTAVK